MDKTLQSSQTIWQNVLQVDETNRYVCCQNKTAHHAKSITLTVKHGGCSHMQIWLLEVSATFVVVVFVASLKGFYFNCLTWLVH